ncbi:hypothetical protein AB0I81_44055 [Nonomuraea sp. NPDC050404]|uniref:hypothetical protein n=1 Tax=Nonomuraea sp. NPDC050404 TaxID=3155783 RepID=UPI0033FA1665
MNELKNLSRVRDEDLAGQVSGAGARALLASVTAEEPQPVRSVSRGFSWSRPRRLAAGAVAVAGLAAAAVIGPAVLGGGATSYANSAMDIRLDGDYYVATIKDPLADHAKYTEAFKAVGLDVRLELVPSSPSQVGKVTGVSMEPGPSPATDRRIGSGTSPSGCTPGRAGCALTLSVKRDYDGGTEIRLGRPAESGEKYRNWGSATRKGEMLEGFRVDEKTVGEVLAETRKRGLKAVYEIITPAPGYNGWRADPDKQSAKVGDDWIVWEARSEQAGVLRLQVTEERLPKNPVFGGPKPASLNQ